MSAIVAIKSRAIDISLNFSWNFLLEQVLNQ